MAQSDSKQPNESNDPPSESPVFEPIESTDPVGDQPIVPHDESTEPHDDLTELVQQKSPGIVAEFVDFILHNKRWWLTPVIIVLLLVGILVILGSGSFAPFIYSAF